MIVAGPGLDLFTLGPEPLPAPRATTPNRRRASLPVFPLVAVN